MSIKLAPGETRQIDVVLTPLPPQFTNKSFETGNAAGWSGSRQGLTGLIVRSSSSNPWELCDGLYYLTFYFWASGKAGDFYEIHQDIDLTLVDIIRFQLRECRQAKFEVLVDNDIVYSLKGQTCPVNHPDQEAVVSQYSGVHTVIFRGTRLVDSASFDPSEACSFDFDNPTCFRKEVK